MKTLGVDTNTWDVTYEALAAKKDTITKLKKLSKTASTVYMATDPDLEGHAIANGLQEVLKLPIKKCIRVTFHEITKPALKNAFDNPSGWAPTKVAAQETRRILDRIVGYKVSPLLWRAFTDGPKGLSAGRVQSAALNMVNNRFGNFQRHDPAMSWSLNASFGSTKFPAHSLTAEAVELIIDTIELAQGHLKTIATHQSLKWDISFNVKESKKSPPKAFTTSTLQQEAYANHRFNAKMTMSLAQALYEEGLITYMRTDSHVLSEDAIGAIRTHITDAHGEAYVGSKVSKSNTKVPHAQEAHEAIRPTTSDTGDDAISFKTHTLTDAHKKLYKLIQKRATASQMACAVYKDISYTITSSKLPDYIFKGKTSLLTFEGFLKVLSPAAMSNRELLDDWDAIVKTVRRVTMATVEAQCSVTRPKLLYTETDLIKAMEKNGIGRPSTYVAIIDKLLSKGYCVKERGPTKVVTLKHLKFSGDGEVTVERQEITIGGSDSDRLVPSELGISILEYLRDTLPSLLDVHFTATMEENLDHIEKGELDKNAVLTDFYNPFDKIITTAMAALPQKSRAGTGADPNYPTFLKWRGISAGELTDADRAALARLPQAIPDNGGRVMLGPYGVYVKTADGKNKKMDKSLWARVVTQDLTASDLA
jgi:DNA topoisomerase-1